MMNAQRQAMAEAANPEHLDIHLSGPPALVQRLLAAMAGSMEEANTPREPQPLHLTRDEAARQSGVSRDKLANLVKVGRLKNYGTPGKMLFSLSEIREWQAQQR